MQSVFNVCEVSHPPLLWLLVPFISRITLEMMMVIMRLVRPLPRPFSHHRQPPRIGAATVIGRPISPWKKTNHEVLHWDSNWRAPRRMPLQYCAPYWNRPVLQSVSSHVEARTPQYKKEWRSFENITSVKNNYIMKMTVLVLLCILHLSVTVQGKNPKIFHN